MSLFTVKMMSGTLPPVTGSNGSNVVKGPPAPTAAHVNPPTHPSFRSLAEYLTDYSTNLHLSMLKELLCLGSPKNSGTAWAMVRPKELQKLEAPEKTSMNVSRRDLALFLTAASFSAVTLSSPKPAEARMSRAEIKKIILEKFKILREKVGLSKPEPEEKEKIATPVPSPSVPEKKTPASPGPSIAEKRVHVLSEPSLPSIQNDKKIIVEAAPLP
ncbi:hypothetical protein Tco_1546586 [Tanacetum coccineum]